MMRYTLRQKFILSHAIVAAFAIFVLLLGFLTIWILKQNMHVLTGQAVPVVESAEKIRTNLQVSLAALRGWANVAEPQFLIERQSAWKTEIAPTLKRLEMLAQVSNDVVLQAKVASLKKQLDELAMWQWRVEDIAQTPGNATIKMLLEERLLPISDNIISLMEELLESVKKPKEQTHGKVSFEIIECLEIFSKASSAFSEYALTGKKSDYYSANASWMLVQHKFNQWVSNWLKLGMPAKSLQQLKVHFAHYAHVLEKLSNTSNSENSRSNIMLISKAVPLARQLDLFLIDLITAQKQKVTAIEQRTQQMVHRIIYAIFMSILGLALFSWWIARRNARRFLTPIALLTDSAQRRVAGEIALLPVTSDDEVGELTQAFNDMLIARQHIDKKMRQILETAVDPILTINSLGIIQYLNSATTQLLGYTTEELLGSNISSIMPEPYRSHHDQYLKNYFETKTKKIIGLSREVEALTKSGQRIPVRLSVSEIHVGEENLFVGILHNIREERERNQKMESLNQKLEIENKEQQIVFAFEEYLRGNENIDEVAEKVLVFFAENFSMIMGMFYLVQPQSQSVKLVQGYGFKERRDRKTEFKWNQTLIGECFKQGHEMVVTDLPENYFKVASGTGEASPQWILLLPLIYESEALGIVECCFFKEITAYQKTLIVKLCGILTISLKMALARKKLQLLLDETEKQKQALQSQEAELRASNEELETQAQALKASEEKLVSSNEELEVQLDLIEKQKEELKVKTEEVSKASQYKSEFLANMSHELRTPLNSLLILAQGFMRNKTGNLTAEQVEEAKIIYDAGSDLLTLINDILDISKVEAGKLNIEVREIVLSDVIIPLQKQFSPIALQKGIHFNVILPEPSDFVMQTDSLRLTQILKNLLSNALKFTEKGSVSLEIQLREETLYFVVKDTGIGIPFNKQALIFSAFQQADGSTSRKYGGTGLGLSISKKLAQLMQGDITLESVDGEGTTFTLMLPLNQLKTVSKEVSLAPPSMPKNYQRLIDIPDNLDEISDSLSDDRMHLIPTKPSILIIDDDSKFVQSLSKIVRQHQFQVLCALTGKTGLALAAMHQPNGIILDLGLPDLSGEFVLSTLKSDERTYHIPVHIVSSRDKSDALLSQGAIKFLQKPVEEADVLAVLDSLPTDKKQTRILIVEDDILMQKKLKEMFTRFISENNIDIAGSSKAAREHLLQSHYACLIIDWTLPDETGAVLISAIVDEMHIKTPIILFTARDLTSSEFKAINQYTNKIIIKGEKEATERLLNEVELFVHHIESKIDFPTQQTQDADLEGTVSVKQKLLLVDDDLRNTFVLSRALEAEGYEVSIADNGEFAIEKLKTAGPFDLILMDMMMPIMDGYEATRKIRAMPEYVLLPIIALTARATQQDREACIEAGASDYMSKPINIEALLELLSIWGGHGGTKAL